jgi:hypothetical protein
VNNFINVQHLDGFFNLDKDSLDNVFKHQPTVIFFDMLIKIDILTVSRQDMNAEQISLNQAAQ